MNKIIFKLIILSLLFNCSNENDYKKILYSNKTLNIFVVDSNGNPIGNIVKSKDNNISASYNGDFRECELLKIEAKNDTVFFKLKLVTYSESGDTLSENIYIAKLKSSDIKRLNNNSDERVKIKIIGEENPGN
jgi:hypothetical protein